MKTETFLIRASEAGRLMTNGGNVITDKQLDRLAELEARKTTPVAITEVQLRRLEEFEKRKKASAVEGSPVKPLTRIMEDELHYLIGIRDNPKPIGLTPNMEEELQSLIAKRDAPFELSQTAKTLVRDIWLRREFGYDEPVMTPVLFKGLLCEQDSLSLVSKVVPTKEFRVKNTQTFYDDDLVGTPDVILDEEDIVEDMKTSWTVKTFFESGLDPDYYAQGQVYLHLTGKKKFRLLYCLVDTPAELVLEEHKRFFFKYGADDENPEYQKAVEKIDRMHYPSRIIIDEKRVKYFEFDYDPEFIAELKRRVGFARDYYATLSL